MLANFVLTLHTSKSCKTVNMDLSVYIYTSYQPPTQTLHYVMEIHQTYYFASSLILPKRVPSSDTPALSESPTLGLGCPSMEAMSPPAKMLLSPWQPRAYNTGWRWSQLLKPFWWVLVLVFLEDSINDFLICKGANRKTPWWNQRFKKQPKKGWNFLIFLITWNESCHIQVLR